MGFFDNVGAWWDEKTNTLSQNWDLFWDTPGVIDGFSAVMSANEARQKAESTYEDRAVKEAMTNIAAAQGKTYEQYYKDSTIIGNVEKAVSAAKNQFRNILILGGIGALVYFYFTNTSFNKATKKFIKGVKKEFS